MNAGNGARQDRVALVTGVSRRNGIGYAVARRLAAQGAHLVLTHHRPHDEQQPWGGDDIDAVVAGVREACRGDQRVIDVSVDLAEPDAPERVMARAVEEFAHVDVLICNHARSGGDGPLGTLTAEMLDAHWAANTRSSLLLAQAFAAQHDGRPGGRVVFMTSGQGQGPMPGEIAYAAAKAALAGVTLTVADQLADAGITVNCVNPGPVDTGYTTPELTEQLKPMFPFGRIGEPDDPARLIAWLVSDDGRWMTGQVLNTEGGFARWRAAAPEGP
ncbi:MAG: SDR family oxidoreductase [Mobilicoccus sp.]|nr:SDR family oxidoreductase [Mobilicoccus sp.]